MKRRNNQGDEPQVVGFIGVGLDNHDEHKRVTHSDHFVLLGGSAETHGQMQDTVVRFEEILQRAGKPLSQIAPETAAELLREAMES